MIFNLNRSVLSIVALWLATVANPAQAQITLTPGNDTGTVLTPNGGATNIDISGGVTAGNNLFHSFERFGVGANQTANFLANPLANPTNIQNVLGRVVGKEASIINGKIQVTGGMNPNLYLMNPAGIIFGSGAKLDVRGSFIATTANGIQIGDQWFSSTGENNYALLTGNPGAFAFTVGQPGVVLNEGTLKLDPGQSILLLGGTVINTGTIDTPDGKITIAAVPGEKLVRISQAGSLLSLELPIADLAPADKLAANGGVTPTIAKTLPELLTGSTPTYAAANLTVDASDGSVHLTGSVSQTPLPITAGNTIVSGTLSGSSPVVNGSRGTAEVIGTDITVATLILGFSDYTFTDGSTQTTAKAGLEKVQFEATNNISVIPGASLIPPPIYAFIDPRLTQTIEFVADSDSNSMGKFSTNPSDTLTPTGANLTISAATVEMGSINTGSFSSRINSFSGNVSVTATTGSISLGDLKTFSGSDGLRGKVTLAAPKGDILVDSINSGYGGIDVNVARFFRARGSLTAGVGCVSQSGCSTGSLSNPYFLPDKISIQHGGESIQFDPSTKLAVSVGSPPRPLTSPLPLQDYFQVNGTGTFDFVVGTDAFKPTNLSEFRDGISGIGGVISIQARSNSGSARVLTSRPFDGNVLVLPVVPPVVPVVPPVAPPVIQEPIAINPIAIQQIQTSTTQTQTTQTQADPAAGKTGGDPASTQRPQVDRTSNSPCNASTLADKPTEPRSRDRNNPCTLSKQDDEQILKILDEPLTPEQGKEIVPQPKQVSWWRLRVDR